MRKAATALLVLTYIGLGFFREFIFLNVNEQMRVTYYHATDSHLSPALSFLNSFSYAQLYYSKWPLTLLFAVLFCLLAVLVIRIGFNTKAYTKLILIAYSGVFLLGALLFFAGSLLGNNAAVYDLSRFLAGLVESPLLLLMLGAGILYYRKSE
ncbi:MAG: hypothetical protein ACRC3B_00780 [Bacteroidia bacterium]